ncbi:MAG TPA: GntR family transcriptional regulator [Ureibacillus sp.]|nr:GntR family transcriptional regulator [Ureibacillus sp.]
MTKQIKKLTIDRGSAIPLYKQIKDILIHELRTNEADASRPFSTEQELVERFRVSRAPVRQALKELANEGYVYRERAKGTFPVQELPVRPLGLELGGLVAFLREQGIDCNSKILDLDRVLPTDNLRSISRLDSRELALRISRLILLKEEPLVWTQTYLFVPDEFNPSVQELEESESVFVLLQNDQGTYVARGDHQIYASGATKEDAEILNLEVGEPVLVMETKLYTRNDIVIGWRRAVHRADEYKLSFTVNR